MYAFSSLSDIFVREMNKLCKDKWNKVSSQNRSQGVEPRQEQETTP